MAHDFRQRSAQRELLDEPNIPFEHVKQNMRELEVINRYLGGHRIAVKGLKRLIHHQPYHKTGHTADAPLHIVEIGSGGGDNLKALAAYCKKQNIQATFTGIDFKEECVQYARQNCARFANIRFVCSDYAKAGFETPPDVLFSSLFCHHFSNEELVEMLQWMHAHSRRGFFINDLHRHRLAYLSIYALTRLFSRSHLVKHDAPVSVLRGFTRANWQALLHRAGLRECVVAWEWAFRFLLVCAKGREHV